MYSGKLVLTCAGLAVAFAMAASPRLLKFEPAVMDFGSVRFDAGSKTVDFVFSNISDKPVSILEVYAQCGCTKAVFDRRPVPVGGMSDISVTLDPSMLYGEQERHLTVISTNGDYRKYNTITLHGFVERDESPAAIRYPYDLGAGLRTDTPVIGMSLSGDGGDPAKTLTVFNDTDKAVVVRIEGSWRVHAGKPCTVEPRSRKDFSISYRTFLMLKGPFHDEIRLFADGLPASVPIRIDGTIK